MNIDLKKNKMIIISSPTGTGKTTICKYLIKKMKNIDLSVSYTTRPIRINEIHGRDYYFVDKKKFLNLKKDNFFIESASVFNNFYYGSPYANIKKSFKRNNSILFDIDWQGAKKLRKYYDQSNIIDFFILPPNKKELKRRLEKRGRDNKNEIKLRLSHAMNEISHHNEYSYVLINDNIDKTMSDLIKIINFTQFIDYNDNKVKKNLKFIK